MIMIIIYNYLNMILIYKAWVLLVFLTIATFVHATPSNEEIMQMVLELKKEIAELKKENKALKGDVENVVVATDEAMKSQIKLINKSSFGGYAELHGNWLEDQKGSSDKDQMDLHRFVLSFNHTYSDKLRLVSELEIEHSVAGDDQVGEVEIERAYIEYDVTDNSSLVAGLFILPIGILNETHEPSTFYGVERNNVEKNIIPTTWWEGGVMLSTNIMDGLNVKLAGHSALQSSATFKPRDGRQKVGEANSESFAYTASAKYSAIPGLTLGASINFQEDFSNGSGLAADDALLYEVHLDYERDAFRLKSLYASWDIKGSGPKALGRDEQFGFYIEPSYKFNDNFGVFARYSQWDNEAGQDASDTEYTQTDYGINWWLDPQVVVKVDYQTQSVGSGITQEMNGINVGMGYAF